MLIVLFLGFGLLAVLGSYLHRRHHRRHDAESAGSQPDLSTWGPGQSAHNIGAVGVAPMSLVNEKAGSSRSDKYGQQRPRKARRVSRRLTKGWLRRTGRGDA